MLTELEEKLKKEIRRVGSLVLTGMIVLSISIMVWQIRIMNQNAKMKESIDTMRIELHDRQFIDSLYHEHLKDCSFIDQKSVKVGRNGVLYSNYHKTL